jgi:hypothetical protein
LRPESCQRNKGTGNKKKKKKKEKKNQKKEQKRKKQIHPMTDCKQNHGIGSLCPINPTHAARAEPLGTILGRNVKRRELPGQSKGEQRQKRRYVLRLAFPPLFSSFPSPSFFLFSFLVTAETSESECAPPIMRQPTTIR